MHLFEDGKINLTKILKNKNEYTFFVNLSFCLKKLTNEEIFIPRVSIGGIYQKNYYNCLKNSFLKNNFNVIILKNSLKSEFLYNSKQNLCNFALYFYKKQGNNFLEIYSGNSFLIDKNLQNFIEKNINEEIILEQNLNNKNLKKIDKYKKIIQVLSIKQNYKKLLNNKNKIIKNQYKISNKIEVFDYYFFKFVSKLKPFIFKIKSKNKVLTKQIKKLKLNKKTSDFCVKISKNLNYQIYYKKQEINKEIFFKNFALLEGLIDFENIVKINLKNLKKVVNNKFLLYNKLTNCFDIFLTLNYISRRITNVKDCSKLVFKTANRI